MGHTFSCILLHTMFSTKERRNLLHKSMRTPLLDYIGGIAINIGAHPIAANAVDDHVHLLMRLKPSAAPSDIVKKIKANSSSWIHKTYSDLSLFAWQAGFGIFSVSKSAERRVISYIAQQEEHHHRIGFAEEYLRFLKRHGVDYDPDHYLD